MSVREVIENTLFENDNYYTSKEEHAVFLIKALAEAGLVICPKEPSEGMKLAGGNAMFSWEHNETPANSYGAGATEIYSAMLLQAEKESK